MTIPDLIERLQRELDADPTLRDKRLITALWEPIQGLVLNRNVYGEVLLHLVRG